jgi:hypothetical protein
MKMIGALTCGATDLEIAVFHSFCFSFSGDMANLKAWEGTNSRPK